MDGEEQRAALQALIDKGGHDYAGLSRLLGRNPAYIQQFMKRGSPRLLPEAERGVLAEFLGVEDAALGGPRAAPPSTLRVRRLEIGASAGPGSLVGEERVAAETQVPREEVRGVAPDRLNTIGVVGDSMLPTLMDGDEILVDSSPPIRLAAGLWVMRIDDALMVKRLSRRGRDWVVTSDNPEAEDPGPWDGARMELRGRVIRSVRRFR
jgi:hypothetical protein